MLARVYFAGHVDSEELDGKQADGVAINAGLSGKVQGAKPIMYQRLRKFVPAWRKLPCISATLLSILMYGLKLDFDAKLGAPLPIWQKNHGCAMADAPFVRDTISAGL